jgi:hypothetical protein
MSDEDIDLDRVVIDPTYRRQVIDFLNSAEPRSRDDNFVAGAATLHPAVEMRPAGRRAF